MIKRAHWVRVREDQGGVGSNLRFRVRLRVRFRVTLRVRLGRSLNLGFSFSFWDLKNTVLTHNMHIFVRPKKVRLFWINVLILGSGGFRIQKLSKKPRIQSWITQFFKNNKKWVLSDSMLKKIQVIYFFKILLFPK